MERTREVAEGLPEELFEGPGRVGDLDRRGALELQELLLEEYRGVDPAEATGSLRRSNGYGDLLHREERVEAGLSTPEPRPERVLGDLKLLRGIGPSREEDLKGEGWSSIRELVEHEKWGDRAREFLEGFEEGGSEAIERVSRWKPSSHPHLLSLASRYSEEEFALLDIETLGLSGRPVILVGMALPEGGSEATVHQLLVEEPGREEAVLDEFLELLCDREAVVTFNGSKFDLPFLGRRMERHGLDGDLDRAHFDLYGFSERAWGDAFPDCRLATVERRVCGVDRPADIPSGLVPEFYSSYLQTGNPGPLVPIVEHNRQDVLTLASLFEGLVDELLE